MTNRRAMKNRVFLFTLFLFLIGGAIHADGIDSLKKGLSPAPLPQLASSTKNKELDAYLHYGFHLGTDFALGNRQLSDYDHLDKLLSGTFGLFVRGGYHYIFAEIGINYMFYKGTYDAKTFDFLPRGKEIVESRYLQIPLKIVGYLNVSRQGNFALMPHIGIMYQPLIHVTSNDIAYGKNNLQKHQFLYQAGLGFRYKFLNVEVAWKKAIRPFFHDRESIKQSYINLLVGFQF